MFIAFFHVRRPSSLNVSSFSVGKLLKSNQTTELDLNVIKSAGRITRERPLTSRKVDKTINSLWLELEERITIAEFLEKACNFFEPDRVCYFSQNGKRLTL